MSWIQTYTGRMFFPLEPRAEDLDVRDVAHALSLQCRFNGHARVFYSVAEHSVRVSRAVAPELALWGLLHDAAEAYVGDLPRPIKARMPAFSLHEDRILEVVARAHDLPWPMPDEVRAADDALLATEARDLLGPPPEDWGLSAAALAETIVPWSAARAEREFLDRHAELWRGRPPTDGLRS